jgi:hypothetical protein
MMALGSTHSVLEAVADALWPSLPVPPSIGGTHNEEVVRYYTVQGSAYTEAINQVSLGWIAPRICVGLEHLPAARSQANAIVKERLFGAGQQQLLL